VREVQEHFKGGTSYKS